MQILGLVNDAATTLANGLTRYFELGGFVFYNVTARPPSSMGRGIIKRLVVNVTANTLDGSTVITVLFENATHVSSLTLTIGAGGVGVFSNIVDEAAVGPQARWDIRVVTAGTGGTITIESVAVLFADPITCAHRSDLV